MLTEGVTHLPFPTLLPLLCPNNFSHKLNLSNRLFFLLAAGAFLSLQQERNQSAGQEERGAYPYSSRHPPSPCIFQMSLSDCPDTLQPFARLFSLFLFFVIYAHYLTPCVCAFLYHANRVGASDIFSALPLGTPLKGRCLRSRQRVAVCG